jgi:hypothetical protein
MNSSRFLSAFVIAVIVAAAACKSGTTPPSSGFIDIQISPSAPVVTPGKTLQFTAKVLGPPGIPQGVTWRSQNTDVATITASGLATGLIEGVAPIRATWVEDSEEYRIVELIVTSVPVEEDRLPRPLPPPRGD